MEKDAVFWDIDEMSRDKRPKPLYSELSFQFLLRKIILWMVHEIASQMNTTVDISRLSVAPKRLPLRKNQQKSLITYQTAIAIKLSHQWNKPVDQVVGYIRQYLQYLINGRLDERNGGAVNVSFSPDTMKIYRTLTVSSHPKGYMQFHGSVTTLTVWLQVMQRAIAHPTQSWKDDCGRCDDVENNSQSQSQSRVGFVLRRNKINRSGGAKRPHYPPNIDTQSRVHSTSRKTSRKTSNARMISADIPFSVFHAHARACAILRMGHKMGQLRLQPLQTNENLIDNDMSEVLHPPWRIDHPKVIPWQVLFSDPQTDQTHSGAIAFSLLIQIITSLDQYADPILGSDNPQKVGAKKRLETLLSLSHAFYRFDADFALCKFDTMMVPLQSVPLRLVSLDDSSVDPWSKQVASLGLILISQRLLHDLLNDILPQDHAWFHIPDQL